MSLARLSRAVLALCFLAGCNLEAPSLEEPLLAQPILRPAFHAIDRAQAREPAPLPLPGVPVPEDAVPEDIVEAEPPTARPPIAPASPDAPAGYVPMTPLSRSGTFGNAILLVHPNEDVIVPIYVGGTEALSIQLRLEHKKFTRPLTHDLLDAFVSKMGAKMIRAQVDALHDAVYIGTVVFKKGTEVIQLDARPSDAIALAIGNGVPIYVSEKLIAEVGIRPGDSDEEPPLPPAEPVAL